MNVSRCTTENDLSMMMQPIKRIFIPGEEWLYLKVYCGTVTSDYLVARLYKEVATRLWDDHLIHRWFFIRYQDPEHHLRIRFQLNQNQFFQPVLERITCFLRPFVDQSLVWKIQIDTYQRELERYGAGRIELAEEFFCYDSQMVCRLLMIMKKDLILEYRWKLSLFFMDAILTNFNLQLSEKQQLTLELTNNCQNEFHLDQPFRKQLDQNFRKRRKEISGLLGDPVNITDFGLMNLIPIVEEHSIRMRPVIAELKVANGPNFWEASMNELIPDFVHMHCNRMFQSHQRWVEIVLYEMLQRYYASRMAVERYGMIRKQAL